MLQNLAADDSLVKDSLADSPSKPSGPIRMGFGGTSKAAPTVGTATSKVAFGSGAKDDDEEEDATRARREAALRRIAEEREKERVVEAEEGEVVGSSHAVEEGEVDLDDIDEKGMRRKKSKLDPALVASLSASVAGSAGKLVSLEETIANISQSIYLATGQRPAASMPASAVLAGAASNPLLPASVIAQAQAITASIAQRAATVPAAQLLGMNVPPAPQPTPAPAPPAKEPANEKDVMKKILDLVPTEKDALLSFRINWTLLDQDKVISTHLKPWVVKKIVEYLGEEEASLTDFIVTKLHAHCTPAELLEELTMVLDADSESFVLKLWKILVFYSIKCEFDHGK